MIQLEHVSKTFTASAGDVHAVKDVNLQIEEGEIFGIIGFSGAGKSTLVRCINLLERPTQGRVFVDGEELTAMDLKRLRQVRRKIGMIFQHFNLLRSRTVYQNIAFPLKKSSLSKAEKDKKILELLDLVGLSDKRDAYPSQLSGGQKQRVAIARALANDPKVLLCDEATSALDNESEHLVGQSLARLAQGRTTLTIAHRLTTIQHADRILVLGENGIEEEGTHEELLAKHGVYHKLWTGAAALDKPMM